MALRAIVRAVAGSVSSTTFCSGASRASGPSRSRAIAVCSTGTKYGCAPALRAAARSSIFGPSAASTRQGSVVGALAKYGAASIPSR